MVCDLVAEAAQAGDIRDDVPPEELAVYCPHALGAAGRLRPPGPRAAVGAGHPGGLRAR